MASGKQLTATGVRNAILAISAKNHRSYHPTYDEWIVAEDDPSQPKDEDVAYYIEKHAPALIPDLTRIIGSTRGKFRAGAA